MTTPDPRLALILAAERLMAQQGVHGPSLREIADAAGNTNNSAVRYHFGDRRALIAAVFEHRMAQVDVRRGVIVDELLAAGRLDIASLVGAFVVPYAKAVDLVGGTTWYGRFSAQAFGELSFDVLAESTDLPCAALRRTIALLRHALTQIDDTDVEMRLELMALLVTHALGDREGRLAAGRDVIGSADAFLEQLLQSSTTMLSAPSVSTAR